jgi:hypothetical protein
MTITKLVENDTTLISSVILAFTTNIFSAVTKIDINAWFAVGTFLLAVIISFLKARVYYYDSKIKKMEYQNMIDKEEKDET